MRFVFICVCLVLAVLQETNAFRDRYPGNENPMDVRRRLRSMKQESRRHGTPSAEEMLEASLYGKPRSNDFPPQIDEQQQQRNPRLLAVLGPRLYTHQHLDIKAGHSDCYEILNKGHTKSGIYRIWPQNWQDKENFHVFCDMETDGGGWTVIQRRGDYNQPKDYFYKTWVEYQRGFGKLNEDFWLGNDRIFSLTDQGNYSLRIDIADLEGEKRYAFYEEFWIEDETQQYKMHVSQFSGDAGDSFSLTNGMKFSTKDRDNDVADPEGSCARGFKGGWWYENCHLSNLNGLYLKGKHKSYADGINWFTWKGYYYSLPIVEMKIRPV